jgi:hypothetical protein
MNTSSIHRRWDTLLCGLLVSVFACVGVQLVTAAPSSAGTYRVIECEPTYALGVPDATASGAIDGFSHQMVVNCTSGGYGLELYSNNFASGPQYASIRLTAPVGTYLHSGSVYWNHHWDVNPSDGWSSAGYVTRDNGPPLITLYGGFQGPSGFSDQWVTIPPTTVGRGLQLDASCASGWYCSSYDSIAFKHINLELVDTTEPRVDALGGSVLDGLVAHGLADLRIVASDEGGGIRIVNVDVNGQRIASPATSCAIYSGGTFVTQMRPCPDFDSTIQVDTERPPWREGQNTLRVCVSDVATEGGPPYSVCEQRSVTVDNSCPDSSGAGEEAHLISAGLENPANGRLLRTRSVRSTDGVTLRGSLAGPGGVVRGASVCVYETVDEPAEIAQLVQVAKSRSDGTFAAHLPPGPSRVFEVAYRYGDRQIETPTMYLDSSVKPSLGVTRKKLANGRRVGFRGGVPGPNADGVAVALQARAGRKWRTFKQLTTNDHGRFRGRYRFTQTHGVTLYVFRALVKKQGGYPYSAGASRKAKVLVRG